MKLNGCKAKIIIVFKCSPFFCNVLILLLYTAKYKIETCTFGSECAKAAHSRVRVPPAGHDCSVRLWMLDNRTCVQEITAHRKKHDEAIHDVAFHASQPFIASAGADALAKIFVWQRRRHSGETHWNAGSRGRLGEAAIVFQHGYLRGAFIF